MMTITRTQDYIQSFVIIHVNKTMMDMDDGTQDNIQSFGLRSLQSRTTTCRIHCYHTIS